MKRPIRMVVSTGLVMLLALMLIPAPGVAQSTASLTARSFDDLSDASDASADNSAVATPGSLLSVLQRLQCVAGLNPSGNSASIMLKVQMGNYRIYNPSTDSFDSVTLRSYNGCPSGPTISIKPGATLKLTLNNTLSATDPTANCPGPADHTTPKCYNNTNIHTHGFHISPSGNSDNVLMTVYPGTVQNYSYKLPPDHPSGTFWYHAHLHGSTAIDVASGMAGVLIVRGSRQAKAGMTNGGADIDTILRRRFLVLSLPVREHVMLFQQIEYGCFGDSTSDKPLADPATFEWICPKGSSTGQIRGYTNQLSFIPDPRPGHTGQLNSTWIISGRYTQINGVVQPVFPSAATYVPAGEIRRLRMVHGGNRDTINVKIVRANLSALGLADSQSLSAAQVNTATTTAANALAKDNTKASQTTTLDRLCSGETVKQLEFAEDGITMSAMVEKDVNTMNPGYRSDVLVAFPSPGLYCILDEAADASATINFRTNATKAKDRRLLSLARVGPGVNIPNTTVGNHSRYWQYIRDQLVAANPTLAQPAKSDLQSLTLRAFAPTIPVDGKVANIVEKQFQIVPQPQPQPALFLISGKPYNPDEVGYTGILGNIDQWNVSASALATHVFHIHTNPFKIMDIKNGNGDSIFNGNGGCTDAEGSDSEYCNLQGVIRDTLFLKAGYTLTMRTVYQDFTGEFVMHCHILDHEDRGMMENVKIMTSTSAYLNRVTAPITAMTKDASRWFAKLAGRDEATLALEASLCTAKDYARR
ncbi:multicopper oxidase domain-containing protein [Caballeronia sp. ATUFL_M2_KS44]|uniref:multicopper oxidase family protein n=1 Tax=Caballeronia sp. ATUFL_M2_KS44 TaxID=2921767 RepID=UPI002028D507|nr:multicopper oxidase domain-containing protein [Caballeronia sp. ATUFL_M2_KS44]